MNWRLRLADYNRAKVEFARAERLLAGALVSYADAHRNGDRPVDPLALGVELARRRALRESRRLTQATFALTRGRPVHEALWSPPDDL